MVHRKLYTMKRINRKGKAVFIGLMILFFLLLDMSHTAAEALERQNSLKEFTAQLNKDIPEMMKDYDIPGAVIAIIQDGEITWVEAYGYADLERGRKMTTDTICRTESISKSVTAWGVMKLAEQGRIALDDSVKKYIKNWEFPDTQYAEENITIRQLLSQSAGMPLGTIGNEYPPEGDIPALKEALSEEARLIQEPGTSFLYSNVGFHLLELLIEEVTGQEFAYYMEKEVLQPLGMYHSSFTWSETFQPPVPMGYDLHGQAVPVYVYPEKASGGLFSSVEDISRFVISGMSNADTGQNVLNSRSVRELYTPVVEIPGLYGMVSEAYGLGHFIEGLPNGKQAVFHGGQGHGWMTHFHSIPEERSGIVIFTNSQRSWPFISSILSDWAEWCNLPSVGMGIIDKGTKVIWAVIGLVFAVSALLLLRIGRELKFCRRRFTPIHKEFRLLRLAQVSSFILLTAVLLWCINQDYLFITSVYPTAYGWLGLSILVFAVALLVAALFPRTEKE